MEFLSIEECLMKQMHVQTSLEPVRVVVQYGPLYLQRYNGVTYIRNDIIRSISKEILISVRDALRTRLYDEI